MCIRDSHRGDRPGACQGRSGRGRRGFVARGVRMRASELVRHRPRGDGGERASGQLGREGKMCIRDRKGTTAEIEENLFVARGTVKAHTSRIYRKLGVHSREELYELLGIAE